MSFKEYIEASDMVIGVIGEFNSGKSSLLNHLLKTVLLPTDVFQTTATINMLKYDTEEYVEIFYKNDTVEKISITELNRLNADQGDHSSISYALIHTSRIPEDIVFIDTPGFNDSDEYRDNLVREILNVCDVIIFVSDATQPLKESEKPYLELNFTQQLLNRTFFVFNNSDQFKDESAYLDTRSDTLKRLSHLYAGQTFIAENQKSDFRTENVFFTCFSSEMLLQSEQRVAKLVMSEIERFENSIASLYAKRTVIISQRKIFANIVKLIAQREDLKRQRDRTDISEENRRRAIINLIDSLKKQYSYGSKFDKLAKKYIKEVYQQTDELINEANKTFRGLVRNRSILQNTFLLERESDKILRILISDIEEKFRVISNDFSSEAINNIFENNLLSEKYAFNLSKVSEAIEKQQTSIYDLNRMQIFSSVGTAGAIIMGTQFLPVAIIGQMALQLYSLNRTTSKLNNTYKKAENDLMFQLEEQFRKVKVQLDMSTKKVVEDTRSSMIMIMTKKQWDIIDYLYTSSSYGEPTGVSMDEQLNELDEEIKRFLTDVKE